MTIKSIRSSNGYPSNFGSVDVQPQGVDTLEHAVQTQGSVQSHPNNPGVLPAYQAKLPVSGISYDSEQNPTSVDNMSLGDIAARVANDPGFIIPIQTKFNNIMPTHALSLDGGRSHDPRSVQAAVTTTTKFQPYESLTGISHERPEVIMLTNFQPLFERDTSASAPKFQNVMEAAGLKQFHTDAGRYIDAQFNIRNMHTFNVNHSIQMLVARYKNFNQQVLSRTSTFNQALNQLKADATFLLNLVRIIESQRSQLDLRHDLYNVDPFETANYLVGNFTQLHLSTNPSDATQVLKQLVQLGHRKSYNVVDVLYDLGYDKDNLVHTFSSTKLWMQLLVEMKGILQHHSLPFIDIKPTYQKNDKNSSAILQPPEKFFTLSATPPSLPNITELIDVQVAQAASTITRLQPAWKTIYQNTFFKNEEARIAALSHLISQEFRYSYGLSRKTVTDALTSKYGYKPAQTGNLQVFDAIVGNFGNNITDFPANPTTSLVSVAQDQASNKLGVLTFETKYVEGDTGTLSPGGDYFFDQILQTDGKSFDTSNIDDLSQRLDDQLNNLAVMIDGFNMMGLPAAPNPDKPGSALDTEDSFLNNPSDLVRLLTARLINPTTGQAFPTDVPDRMTSIYNYALKNPKIKTILFLYTLSRISRAYTDNVPFLQSSQQSDNTPLVDYLIKQLVDELIASVPESRAVTQLVTQSGLGNVNTDALTEASIKSAMKTGGLRAELIEQFMSYVIHEFKSRTSAINGSYTRYSGYLDTIVFMAAFDFAIAVVSRYSNQQIVGQHKGTKKFSSGQVTFAVAQTSTNHSVSFNELKQRLNAEANLSREVIMTVVNILRKLTGSLKGVSNYLNGPQAKDSIAEISVNLDSKKLLHMLLNEQQIMLLASTVDSLVAANAAQGQSSAGDTSDHADGSTANQQLTVLDESDVPLAMKNALNGYFGQGDLATAEANNNAILTIGIPFGFTQRLKQKVNIQNQKKASFQNKQNDIVQIVVYKVDLTNPDIIYKPQRYLFEMSRFPTRYGTAQWLPLADEPSLADIVNAIPTQCYSQNIDSSTSISITSGVEYASTAIADSSGIKGARSAFGGSSYSFLTHQQKAELLNNHVASQLLDSYIKLMTGINVAEYNYDMVAPPGPVETFFVKTVVDHVVDHLSEVVAQQNVFQAPSVLNPVGGILFSTTSPPRLPPVLNTFGSRFQTSPILSNPAGVAGQVDPASQFRAMPPGDAGSLRVTSLEQQQVIGDVQTNMGIFGQRNTSLVLTHLQTISTFTRTWSSISDVSALNKKVLSPKQFDRVFNILVDPRDFMIDVAKTNSTPWGRTALNQLIAAGDLVPTDLDPVSLRLRSFAPFSLQAGGKTLQGRSFPQGRAAPNVSSYIWRNRDKNQGDLVADKYFVTIETYGEGQT